MVTMTPGATWRRWFLLRVGNRRRSFSSSSSSSSYRFLPSALLEQLLLLLLLLLLLRRQGRCSRFSSSSSCSFFFFFFFFFFFPLFSLLPSLVSFSLLLSVSSRSLPLSLLRVPPRLINSPSPNSTIAREMIQPFRFHDCILHGLVRHSFHLRIRLVRFRFQLFTTLEMESEREEKWKSAEVGRDIDGRENLHPGNHFLLLLLILLLVLLVLLSS